jgi:hypothetical protein
MSGTLRPPGFITTDLRFPTWSELRNLELVPSVGERVSDATGTICRVAGVRPDGVDRYVVVCEALRSKPRILRDMASVLLRRALLARYPETARADEAQRR